MTKPLRSLTPTPGTLTRLERAMLDALVGELSGTLPGLASQVAGSLPTRRTNTGFGLFTELVPRIPARQPVSGISGDFGTVHAMIGNLKKPVAFTVRVHNGLLVGLMGDSYGQDTRHIDFATVPYDCVFIIDANGRSVEVKAIAHASNTEERSAERAYNRLNADKPRQDRPKVARAQPTPTSTARPAARSQASTPASTSTPTTDPVPVQLVQALGGPLLGTVLAEAARAGQRDRKVDGHPLSTTTPDRLTDGQIKAVIWGGAAILAMFANLIFDIPFPFNLFLFGALAASMTGKKNWPKVRKFVDDAMEASGKR